MEARNIESCTLHEALAFLDELGAVSEAHRTGAATVPLRLAVPGWQCSDAEPLNFDLATQQQEAAVTDLLQALAGEPPPAEEGCLA